VTPNQLSWLPGSEHEGVDPDGFLPREQIVAYFEDYIRRFNLPVRFGVRVTAIGRAENGYRVTTDGETLQAANVVIATGFFQHPKAPAFSQNLPPRIVQLHSGQYRNPDSLPSGAVLVVGRIRLPDCRRAVSKRAEGLPVGRRRGSLSQTLSRDGWFRLADAHWFL
jgi:putative flavoprotein involved in K+ transport